MTATTCVTTASGTLVAATVDTVTFGYNYRQIEVVNRGTGDIFVSLDGVTAPTVGGLEFSVVPSNSSAIFANKQLPNETITNFNLLNQDLSHGDTTTSVAVIKLISSGTPTYTVSGTTTQRGV